MINALHIARRDLAAYLAGITGWVIVAAVLFITGLWFQAFALGSGPALSHEVLSRFFDTVGGTTMIASVLLTMRSVAEERQTGTDVLLHTAPVKDRDVILGKYLAAMGMLALLLALTLYMPAMILVNGKISYQHVLVGYLGTLALGSATASMGIFGSSLFRSQLPAGIISGVLVVTFLVGWLLSSLVDPPFTDVTAYMALFQEHFKPFEDGKLQSSSLIYFASLTWGFLMLSTRILEGRRWQ